MRNVNIGVEAQLYIERVRASCISSVVIAHISLGLLAICSHFLFLVSCSVCASRESHSTLTPRPSPAVSTGNEAQQPEAQQPEAQSTPCCQLWCLFLICIYLRNERFLVRLTLQTAAQYILQLRTRREFEPLLISLPKLSCIYFTICVYIYSAGQPASFSQQDAS